jgi:3',5'-nucleoside bisphosphate phosphatase
LQIFRAELHIHTVLSPCAEVEMIPPLIVEQALEAGLNLIAITDHNATANCQAVIQAAAGTGLSVLPGVEAQSREEVHILCLFDTLQQAAFFQSTIDAYLPPLMNQPDHFGEQMLVDLTGDLLGLEKRLLISSLDLSLEEIAAEVERLGGLAIPAHVDRPAFGLIANLVFVPENLRAPALEISRRITPGQAVRKYPQIEGYPLLTGGDAHRLEEILGANTFCLESATTAEIRMALKGEGGRQFQSSGRGALHLDVQDNLHIQGSDI